MASGCVPILSHAASLPELIEDGVSGILVKPNSPHAIEDAVQRLQTDKESWRGLAVYARQRAETKYGWERVAERCIEIYEEN